MHAWLMLPHSSRYRQSPINLPSMADWCYHSSRQHQPPINRHPSIHCLADVATAFDSIIYHQSPSMQADWCYHHTQQSTSRTIIQQQSTSWTINQSPPTADWRHHSNRQHHVPSISIHPWPNGGTTHSSRPHQPSLHPWPTDITAVHRINHQSPSRTDWCQHSSRQRQPSISAHYWLILPKQLISSIINQSSNHAWLMLPHTAVGIINHPSIIHPWPKIDATTHSSRLINPSISIHD